MSEYFPDYKAPEFKSILIFELRSWIGRKCYKKRSRFISSNTPFLIDVGSGANFTNGWTHVDFFRIYHRKFWRKKSIQKSPEIETDLRFPLDCPSNVSDGIYSGHTLEHLYPNHAFQLLSEIYRILKPGSWLRINVPDLELCVDYYNGKSESFSYRFKAEAIGNCTQNWGHHSVWDKELLSNALQMTGFVKVRKVKFGKEGTDIRLIKEQEVREFETLVIEAQKPLK